MSAEASSPRPSVTVVGSGLAGMTAALRLLERGCDVKIIESISRPGGKAGSNQNGSDYDDHGYHIFPAWYLNVWKMVDELGIRDHFVDRTDFLQLRQGQFPRWKTMRNMTALSSVWRNLNAGVLPFQQACLFFYSALDLVSQHYNERAFLDQISISGFIRSRFYRTEQVAREFQDLMLKGISVPTYLVSAMTMQRVMQNWLAYPLPMFRITRGDLQNLFIEPLARRLTQLGCSIELNQRLTRIHVQDQRVVAIETHDETGGETQRRPVDHVIIAIPCEKLLEVVDDDLYRAAPTIANVAYLRAEPMAALDLYLNRSFPDLPGSHINLLGSRFGLSFIDVSRVWPHRDTSVLQLIASDFQPLEKLTADEAVQQMVVELMRFLPGLEWSDIDHYNFQSNVTEPLFMNDVGVWQYRPTARTELDNLYLAGDYCQSHVDLVCMEGAVCTGLLAAEALRTDLGVGSPIEMLTPSLIPRWLFVTGRMALSPVALACKLASLSASSSDQSVSDPAQQ